VLLVAATELELARLQGVETLCCGIGPVEAACATAATLAGRRPTCVVNVGIAGARDLVPGTLVLGARAVYCDLLDAESTLPLVARVEPDAGLLAAARAALPEAEVLPIATSARVGGGHRFADVEAMEGFAVLRAAATAGVPALELRAVSNGYGTSRGEWLIGDALDALARGVARLVEVVDA
jgi:nucleoside phosphorylase